MTLWSDQFWYLPKAFLKANAMWYIQENLTNLLWYPFILQKTSPLICISKHLLATEIARISMFLSILDNYRDLQCIAKWTSKYSYVLWKLTARWPSKFVWLLMIFHKSKLIHFCFKFNSFIVNLWFLYGSYFGHFWSF